MKKNILTGVISLSEVPNQELLNECLNTSIDVDLEVELRENPYMSDDDLLFFEGSTFLIGYKFDKKTNLYEIDYDSDFSAIVTYDNFYVMQVTYSQCTKMCNMCSPCFPDQGDLTSNGNLECYDLPKEYYKV
jgi:hypothetical protein